MTSAAAVAAAAPARYARGVLAIVVSRAEEPRGRNSFATTGVTMVVR